MIRVLLKTVRVWLHEDWLATIIYLPPRFLFALWSIGVGYFTTTREQRERLMTARLKICQGGCVMYDEKYGTCGHIGHFALGRPDNMSLVNRIKNEPKQVGCWCRLKVAAKLPKKTCWKTVRGIPGGWPENKPLT